MSVETGNLNERPLNILHLKIFIRNKEDTYEIVIINSHKN